MESGAIVPEHPHTLEEQCLVLEGEVWVGDHLLRSGDWHVAQPGSHHGNFSTRTGCLLLIKSEVLSEP
jgi:quercetin dioxygenase-like cupin family protein